MSGIQVDQVEVGRHLKLKAIGVKLDVHSGSDFVGVWLSGPSGGENVLGLFMRRNEPPFIQLFAPKEMKFSLPFAFGGHGLQIPKRGGGAVVIPLTVISEMAAAWEAQHGDQRPPYTPMKPADNDSRT